MISKAFTGELLMRWMFAVAVAGLVCVAIACDQSSSSSNPQKSLPPDMQQESAPATAATSAPSPSSAPATQTSAGQPINKFCAVEKDNEIDPKVTTVYEGKTIAFCCKDCIADFKKDPAKYMASLK
jgi:YHS domain-containing protein